ncbi:MAG: ABC transporter ATP-binding protein [bacterium]|nr:ABC transporter ATP-binding protein [bacterium]
MPNTVLEVKNLTKKFGNFTAVDNLSFSIKEGEILGLLGPNGAGKTTTIHMLLDLTTPTTGEITYFGKPFKKAREKILKDVNFSSTYISMPWLFTVNEILDIFASLYEVPDRKKRVQKLLREFELDDLANKQFYLLSAGEKTRLFLTKAFINYPKIILLDEPTASLDPDIAVKVREFLKKQKKEYNVSMLFTSHNMAEIEEMCDRVLILHHGKIIDEGTPTDLARKITDCIVELTIAKDKKRASSFLQEKGLPFEEEKNIFRIPVDEKNIADLLALLAHEGIDYDAISINKPSLEDYFLKTLGDKT